MITVLLFIAACLCSFVLGNISAVRLLLAIAPRAERAVNAQTISAPSGSPIALQLWKVRKNRRRKMLENVRRLWPGATEAQIFGDVFE